MKSHTLLVVVLSIGALILGLSLNYALTPSVPKQPAIEGLLWPQSKPLTDFTLTDQNGQPFTLQNFKGKWSLIYFGYTHCPDVCPTTLSLLKAVKQELTAAAPKETANTQYVLVSVDGERDTPTVLASYIKYFDPTFIGVTGSDAQLNTLTQQLGIVYMRVPKDNTYLVDHSSSILLIDPRGQMIALFSAPHAIETLTARYLAIRKLLAQHF